MKYRDIYRFYVDPLSSFISSIIIGYSKKRVENSKKLI